MSIAVRVAVALLVLLPAAVAGAQGREYRVEGTVVDAAQQPIAGAVVDLRERTTRRAFRMKTDGTGAFKMVGLPHGVYEVTISRAGYQSRTHEWDLSEARETMKKVVFDPYVLLSEQQVAARERKAAQQRLFEEATELVSTGDMAAALPLLERLLAESPDDTNARYVHAVCLLEGDRTAEAAAELETVVAANPSFAPAHTNLGICHERLGNGAKALASYDAAIALDPTSQLALYNAGVLHYNARDAARALPYFEKILVTAPNDDRALEMAGYCELQSGNYTRALAYLERSRPAIAEPERAAAIDEIIRELRPRAQEASGGGGGA